MNLPWDDVNARARGLSTHFLARAELEELARLPDLAALAEAFGRAGFPMPSRGDADGAALELAVRRWGGQALAVLADWMGPRSEALPLVFDQEDVRSLRALIRGAASQQPAAERLAGLLPTPTLGEGALEMLAAVPTVAALAALLTTWRHPFAPTLAPLATGPAPDLFELEVALAKASAARAIAAAKRSGSHPLLVWVAERIDLENGQTAMLLAQGQADLAPASLFIPDGRRLMASQFAAAVATGHPATAGHRIAVALAGTPYAPLFEKWTGDLEALRRSLLVIRVRLLGHQVRIAPLGPITTLWLGLRLRAQVLDLQRIVWGIALDAPRATLVEQLLTEGG